VGRRGGQEGEGLRDGQEGEGLHRGALAWGASQRHVGGRGACDRKLSISSGEGLGRVPTLSRADPGEGKGRGCRGEGQMGL